MPRAMLPVIFLVILGLILTVGLLRDPGPDWAEVEEKIRTRFPTVPQISSHELAAWLDDGHRMAPLLLDVRQSEEFAVSHLPGAIRIDPAAERPTLPKGVTFDTPIVTYCSVGYRSSALARRLIALGFSDVSNLEGSIFQWANEGRLVVRNGRPVREVHPFDPRWGRLLDSDLHPPGLP